MYTGVFIFFIGSQRLIFLPKCHRHIWIQNYVTQRPVVFTYALWAEELISDATGNGEMVAVFEQIGGQAK